MARSKSATSAGGTKKPRRPRAKKGVKEAVGLTPADVQAAPPPPEVIGLQEAVRHDGGTVLASYREPFGGTWIVQAMLPM